MVTIPWWIWLIVLGVCFSAYMTFRTAREEKQIEIQFIEEEGKKYMERIAEERKKRGLVKE
ncbi:sporulation YhaL family protein [Ornithinibacillus sp. 4-3]|uniref:Sporulation YhaL family protein n=1 Tax=Ornithinibacillus sp. 4-3 TaxID=3231488 RepID=A0AB39HU00_9BACI